MAEEWPIESARVLEYESDLDRLSRGIDQHLQHARERKWTRALQWFRNAAFLTGQHLDVFRYAQGTFTQNAIVIPSRFQDAMSPHMVDNHVLRIVQANIAELTGMNPYPVIEPASMDPDDIDLARIGELIVQVLWEKPLRVPEKLRMMIGYLAITGTAAAEVYFGELDSVEERMKMKRAKVLDLTGEDVDQWFESDETEWVRRLGLRMRIWSGFHLDVNPDATQDPDSLTWVCRTTFEDLTLARRMFDRNEKGYHPENLKGLGPTEHTDDPLWHWEQMKDLVDSPEGNVPVTLASGSRRTLAQCTRVRVIDTRPNLEHPMGRTIVQVGGKIAYAGPARSWSEAYPDRWTPMQICRWWTVPGRFEGIPLCSPIVPLQKRVNALDCIIRLNRQHMGIGVILAPRNSGVPAGMIGPVVGQQLTYKPGPRGEKPEPWPFTPLTSDIWEERAGCIAAMDRIGGIASAQLAQSSPSAIRSGVMLDFGQRQGLQSKSAILLDFEAFVGDLVEAILQETSRNMAENPDLLRRVRVAARDLGDLAIDRFTKLDLGDNVRARIDLRSQMMQTPEAKKEAAAVFLQFAGPNMSPSERARVALVMGLDELEGQVSAQYKRVRRMVERVMQGDLSAAVPLEGVDDPGLFAEVIRDAMLSERATAAPLAVKQALQALLDGYSEKVAARAQSMARAVAMGAENSTPVANGNSEPQTGA